MVIENNKEMLPSIPYVIIQNDSYGTIQYANDLFYNLLHCNQADLEYLCGMRFSALLQVDDVMEIKDFLAQTKVHKLEIELLINAHVSTPLWVYAWFQKEEKNEYVYVFLMDICEYKDDVNKLHNLQNKMNKILDHSDLDVIEFNLNSYHIRYHHCNTYFNEESLQMDFKSCMLESGISKTDKDVFLNATSVLLDSENRENKVTCEIHMRQKYNEYVWTRLTMLLTVQPDSEPYVLAIFANIDAEKEATTNYIDQSLFYQSMLSAQDAYGHIDLDMDCCLKMGGLWNLYNELTDKKPYMELVTLYVEKVIHPDDRARYLEVMQRENIIASYENNIKHLGCEFRRIVDQNSLTWMKLYIHPFRNPLNHHIMALMYIQNIDERKKALTISKSHSYDKLTKLYDRNATSELIYEHLMHMNNSSESALLLINIDRMKEINEKMGYAKGDAVILALSDIISAVFRKRDIIGRYGGDEFLVVLKDIDTNSLKQRVEKLLQVIAQLTKLTFSVSIGIVYMHHGDSLLNSMKQASIALYQAKKQPGSYFIFKEDDVQEGISQDVQLERYLAHKVPKMSGEVNYTTAKIDRLVGQQGDLAYLVNTKTYELIDGNQAFYSRLGVSKEECIGRTCYDLLHNRSYPCPYCQKANWTTDKFYMYRNYNPVLEQEFLIKNKLVSWKNSTALLAIAIDLSNNKSVVDSMNNEITEDNYILNGVSNMQKAASIDHAIYFGLETILDFFEAGCVRFWRYDDATQTLQVPITHLNAHERKQIDIIEQSDFESVNKWIAENKWNEFINIESQEAMMLKSYDMYQMMKKRHIYNTRWLGMQNNQGVYGFIEVNNISANFQNVSFLTSFTTYIGNEIDKFIMMDNIRYHASHDSLTGLLNRASYEEFIQTYNEDYVSSIAIVMADINALGSINARKGSNVGDVYIQQLSKYLKKVFEDALMYRLSGDEFLVILHNISVEETERKVDELQMLLDGFGLFSVSIGYSWDGVEKKLSTLMEYARQNMMHHKQQYHNDVQEDDNKEHYAIQHDLLRDLKRGDYEIYLQPKVDVRNGLTVGAEALIRYHAKDTSIVQPSKFIPLFEKNGLIRYVDLFVFEEVCKVLQRWAKEGIQCPNISLNFSRVTMLENNLVPILEAIFNKYEIDKKWIQIEITESYADVGKASLYKSAKQIHEAGFAVALDDFGTDFTNLSILSDIYVDELKIDKSLIHSMAIQKKNQIILKNIIQMCRDLGVEVIAEGVEEEEQREVLTQLGCYLIQGYLYSKPICVQDFEKQFLNLNVIA